jgi:hypothetical protein
MKIVIPLRRFGTSVSVRSLSRRADCAMRKGDMTTRNRLATLTLGFALAFGWAAAPAEATSVTIMNVTVRSAITTGAVTDTRTWCMLLCGPNQGAGDIWAAYANTVVNSPSSGGTQALVLTQNPTATIGSFNFDTSEHIFDDNRPAVSCGQDSASTCVMTLTILTNLFGLVNVPLPLNNALNNFNGDPGGTHQEARNWETSVLNQPGGLHVWVGYADNAHPGEPNPPGTCGDMAGQIPLNCLPDNPWQGSPNTIFAGQAVPNTPELQGCLRTGITSCFDAGAVRIEVNEPLQEAVPEPASMTLVCTGVAALVARRYRQRRDGRGTKASV